MTSGETTVRGLMGSTTAEALADPRLRSLLDGVMPRDDMQAFFRRFLVTHLNSVQILAFLTSIAPPQVMQAVKENLLEEMGFEESEKSHPELVEDLARGLGYSDRDLILVHAEADEARRAFISSPIPYPTMREFGLAMLLENVAFEYFLSRFSDGMAGALTTHYGLTPESVMWFTLHGEVDIRHAEEGQLAILNYVSHYRFGPEEFEQIARRTFAENVVLNRYFPPDSAAPSRHSTGTVRAIEAMPLRIPFQQAFTHSTMSRAESDAIVVRVIGADGIRGYGESLPRPYVTGEDVGAVVGALRDDLGTRALGMTLDFGLAAVPQIDEFLTEWKRNRPTSVGIVAWNATACALELALLDWAFRRAGQSVMTWLPPARANVTYTGVIDASDPAAAAEMARRFAQAGMNSIKVKIGIDDDAARLQAVREAVGDDIEIRVDANGVWSADTAAAALNMLTPFKIVAVEQPVMATDLDGMRRVREQTGLRVIADESLVTEDTAAALIAANACDVFNIRISKCGGLIASARIAQMAAEAGMGVQVGAQVGETSLLSAAGRALAAHVPSLEYLEGSFGTRLLSEDIAFEPVMFGYAGRGELLPRPGLGVAVNEDALERLAQEMISIEPQGR